MTTPVPLVTTLNRWAQERRASDQLRAAGRPSILHLARDRRIARHLRRVRGRNGTCKCTYCRVGEES